MKGALGLTIAAGLGIVGAVCNWLYLQRLSAEQVMVSFIAVKPGVTLNIGETFAEGDLEPVPIPGARMGNLIERAPQWSSRSAVVGYPANRVFRGGEILLVADLEAPAARDLAETLQADEVARWVPIDARTVVSEQINPGDLVSFDVGGAAGPTPAGSNSPDPSSGSEIIGPFRVLALGTRREPVNVQEASRTRGSTGTGTIAIVVKLVDDKYEPKAARLFEKLRTSGDRGVSVQLHSRRTR